MPIPIAGLAKALGLGFQGYGQDQSNLFNRTRLLQGDAMAQQLHGAQMDNYAAEATDHRAQAQQRADQATREQSEHDVLSQFGEAAAGGDKSAQMRIVATFGSRAPSVLEEFRKINAPPPKAKRVYDPNRGVMVDEDAGTAAPVAGLPPDPTKGPTPGSPAWIAMKRQEASITADAAPPIAVQKSDGTTEFVTREQALGRARATNAQQPGNQQAQQARLLAAVSEARLADERMRAYEEKLLTKKAAINPLEQAGGTLTTNLSGTHGAVGAGMQAAAEYLLNKNDPDYAQYLRDASTIGRAEQMMSPRGGNETMVRANALLSRAGTGAMEQTIRASRMARQALFGKSGGVEQSLSPEQSQRLEAGVNKIKQEGGVGSAPASRGAVNLGVSTITPAERDGLRKLGYTDAQITAKYGPPE